VFVGPSYVTASVHRGGGVHAISITAIGDKRRLAQPGAVPPAARRIGVLLGEIAMDIHHPGVRAGVKRLARSLASDAGAPQAAGAVRLGTDTPAAPIDPVAARLIS